MNNSFKNSLNNETQNENKWCARLAYKCGICGKEHESVKDRAECELKCFKKQEETKRLAAEMKKKEEQSARKKEVDDAIDYACKLKEKYIEDYGGYVRFYDTDLDSIVDFLRMLP